MTTTYQRSEAAQASRDNAFRNAARRKYNAVAAAAEETFQSDFGIPFHFEWDGEIFMHKTLWFRVLDLDLVTDEGSWWISLHNGAVAFETSIEDIRTQY